MSILSTRPAGAADPLVAGLQAAGHVVHAVPAVGIVPVEPGTALDTAAAALRTFDWVVLTSAPGASALLAAADRAGTLDAARASAGDARRRWAAVGRATAAVLEAAGLVVNVVPPVARGRAIAAALSAGGDPLRGQRILLPRSDLADPGLPGDLRSAGALVHEVTAYRTVEGPLESAEPLGRALADPSLQAIVLCSGSAVRGVLALSRSDGSLGRNGSGGTHPRLTGTPLVSIGPATSEIIRGAGLTVAVEAARPSVEAIVEAVGRLLGAPLAERTPDALRAPS